MIRDIGQGRHEKRWKSGIVRVRGKAAGGGGGGWVCGLFFLPPPSRDPQLFMISFSSHDLDLVALCL